MFNILRTARASGASQRLFSSSASRSADLAKLILVGRLGKAPEIKRTANNKEYASYVVATTNYPPPPANPDGSRPSSRTSWHTVFSFHPNSFDFLRTLNKGALVYVETNYELRDPDPTAEPGSAQAQRQIFLRHETIRLLKNTPKSSQEYTEGDDEGEGESERS